MVPLSLKMRNTVPDKTVYLSLGSNVGDRHAHLQCALTRLEGEQIQVQRQSSIYETEPRDILQQPWFLNMVVECQTRLFPLQLLKMLQRIEREVGRVREGAIHRGPRVIDIDILLFGHVVMNTPELTIPHPRMTERRFVLEPLREIAPEIRHPATKRELNHYLNRLINQEVRKTV
jgi:2-amino-4-hydroxy-6-hydroxymethyldihydropteridine diphosphokinase